MGIIREIKIVKYLRRLLLTILPLQEGVAMLEFLLCVPLLLIIFFGTVEVSRYFLAIQKAEKTIDMVTDTIARSDPNTPSEKLTTGNLTSLMNAVSSMMHPYDFSSNGLVIITDVSKTTGQSPVINWQFCGGGSLDATSAIGPASGTTTKQPATLPSGFTMTDGEEVLIGEIFYNFSPITVQDMIGSIQVYRVVYFAPRLGGTNSLTSKCN